MIGFEEFLSALIVAVLLLIVMSIPKLIIYLIWTIYKIYIYGTAARLLKNERVRKTLPQRVHELLLRSSENPEEVIKNKINAINEYQKNVSEPLIEAISSLGMILIIFHFVSLDPSVEQVIFWLGIMLVILIFASLGLVWHLMRLADKLLALVPEALEKGTSESKSKNLQKA